MHSISRWRSRLNGMASISLTAEGLSSSLYFATLPQIFQDFFKWEVGFGGPRLEGGQILGILSQAKLYRLIDQLGHRLLRLGGLEPQGPEVRIEIDGRLSSARLFIKLTIMPNA